MASHCVGPGRQVREGTLQQRPLGRGETGVPDESIQPLFPCSEHARNQSPSRFERLQVADTYDIVPMTIERLSEDAFVLGQCPIEVTGIVVGFQGQQLRGLLASRVNPPLHFLGGVLFQLREERLDAHGRDTTLRPHAG